MGYDEITVHYKFTNDVAELIDLSEFAGQTVTVVYSVDTVETGYRIFIVEIDVIVPESK